MTGRQAVPPQCVARPVEVFGFAAVEGIDFRGGWIRHRQVRLVGAEPVSVLPEGGRVRSVPPPDRPAAALEALVKEFPPAEITSARARQ
ncbi:hypothetical protein [Streptomyces hirsutus]|uniref:hypothetical protein n=1 Tax=Streptomyces hirsutus TaxID=35620 RepID=UPI0033EA1177